jgi:type IV secretion system protein VirD4
VEPPLSTLPGVVLGSFEGRWLVDFSDTHLGLIGPTSSGKDLSGILPIVGTYPGCMLIADPKNGDTHRRTQAWRERFSTVIAYAPKRRISADINVLGSVRLGSDDEYLDALHIAGSLTAPMHMARHTQAEMHFHEMAETLLSGGILHTLYTSPRKSLPGVLDFFTGHHGSVKDVVTTLINSKHLGTQPHDIIASIGQEINQIEARELGSIWSTMMRGLHLYRDPTIAGHSDRSSIDLSTLQTGRRPVTMYLIAPSPELLVQLHPLYRVVFETIVHVTTRQGLGRPRHPMFVAWNEFPSFGWVRTIETDIATLREYGWRIMLCCQDLGQLWKTYGEDTAIWGNLHIKIFHTPEHDLTAKRISENILGWRTMERDVAHENPYAWFRKTTSVSPQRQSELLMPTSEVLQMPPDDMIIKVGGLPPIYAQKVWFHRNRMLKRRIAA